MLPLGVIVATELALVLQVPLAVASLKIVVELVQTAVPPRIGVGVVVTVSTAVEVQPFNVYEMRDVPVAIPLTVPDEGSTVATLVVVLAHVPPVGVSLKIVIVPPQIVVLPVIAAGCGLTVIITVPPKGTAEQAVVVILNKL